jgi:UDP-N-acetylglucosamine:LPS N-acetylglucosamine transferase
VATERQRALIFTASIGAGHDVPAHLLADELRARGMSAQVVDGLPVMGPVLGAIIAGGSSLDTLAGNVAFDVGYALGSRVRALRPVGPKLIGLARRRMTAFLRQYPADVLVSVYPGTTELLGQLRASGALRTPVVAAITDLAALRLWAHPGVDLHLVIHPESMPEVRSIAGDGARIEAVHGLSDLRFMDPPERDDARRELGLPATGAIVVVSGGGWGVGDLRGATDEALAAGAGRVIVLAGNNEALREQLTDAYAGDERVQVWGFTDRMVALLAAADVLIHATAGLTVLEATMCGCRVISYGWARGHVRVNNSAYERLRLATVVRRRAQLGGALRAALDAPPLGHDVPDLPLAADLVLDLAASGREPARAG